MPRLVGSAGSNPVSSSRLGWAVIATLVIVGMVIGVSAGVTFDQPLVIVR